MPKRAEGLIGKTLRTLGPGMHGDGGGLYLRVIPSGGRSWVFRYSLNGRRRDMPLGSLDTFTLSDARERARQARQQVADGIDPIDARAATKAEAAKPKPGRTFEAVAQRFIAANEPGWRNEKHVLQWRSTLATYILPIIGTLDVDEIETSHVLEILSPIWSTKPETASRVRGRIEAILDAAKVQGLRKGENPARWRGHLSALLPAKRKVRRVKHHASLPYPEMPGLWPRLEAADGMSAWALRFAILTATRSGEVRGALWSEIDLDAGLWTIPAERMKAEKEHRVPLSEPALAILRTMQGIQTCDLVFPGRRKQALSDMALAMVLRRMQLDVTVHGFRSSFRTWVAEETSIPVDIAEAALAHTPPNAMIEIYQRGDLLKRRRQLMDAWAAFVTTPAAGSNVLPLRRA